MSETGRPSRRWRISLRTLLEALFVLAAIFAVAREFHRTTIKSGDTLEIRVVGTLQDQPIDGFFQVDADGKLSLGPSYGRVAVENLSTDEAVAAIQNHLRQILRDPEVSVSRVTYNEACRRLQAHNRRLQAELDALQPAQASVLVQPTVQNYSDDSMSHYDRSLINDLPSK